MFLFPSWESLDRDTYIFCILAYVESVHDWLEMRHPAVLRWFQCSTKILTTDYHEDLSSPLLTYLARQ